jgi:hypothetical protein
VSTINARTVVMSGFLALVASPLAVRLAFFFQFSHSRLSAFDLIMFANLSLLLLCIAFIQGTLGHPHHHHHNHRVHTTVTSECFPLRVRTQSYCGILAVDGAEATVVTSRGGGAITLADEGPTTTFAGETYTVTTTTTGLTTAVTSKYDLFASTFQSLTSYP